MNLNFHFYLECDRVPVSTHLAVIEKFGSSKFPQSLLQLRSWVARKYIIIHAMHYIQYP